MRFKIIYKNDMKAVEKQLSIITVTWNNEEIISKQIESVRRGCKTLSFEHIVVDNNSSDSTIEKVKHFPHVQLIANTNNRGFGAANNQGTEIACGEFLLFLNPDMVVQEGSLERMYEWMKSHPDVGIAGVKLVDENGKPNIEALPRRFPKVWEQVALILKLPHLFPGILNKYLMKGFDTEKEQEVDSVRAAFMVVRRQVIESLGWIFDPRYYIWFEDVDTCKEVHRLGLKLVYTPIVTCVDFVGQSFKKRDTLWKQKNFTRSMLTYFQKWEPWYKWIWIAIFRPVGIGLAAMNDFVYKIKE